MYNSNRTNTKGSILRGYWIIILSVILVMTFVAYPYVSYDKPDTLTIVRALIPVSEISFTEQPVINEVGWVERGFNRIIEEIAPLLTDIINIPNNHFKDVRDNHQHPGLLPTINSEGQMIQKTPCVRVNLIYPDDTIEVTCIRKTMYHD